jgi:hypothetical protein
MNMENWNRRRIQSLKQEIIQCHCYSGEGRYHRILLEIEDSLDSLDSYLARLGVYSLRELSNKEEEDLLPYGVHAWESLQEKTERAKEIDTAAREALKPKLKVLSNESLESNTKGDKTNNESGNDKQ